MKTKVLVISFLFAAIALPLLVLGDGTFPGSKEKMLLDFIERNLSGEEGEYYSSIKKGSVDKRTLSESVGLIMNYSIYKKDMELFSRQSKFIKNNLCEDWLVKWIDENSCSCNSLIDDLRIIRGYLDAYELWKQKYCLDMAGFLQQAIYDRQVQNGLIYQFYDWDAQKAKSDIIPLCYFDLYTMYRLEKFNKGWSEIRGNCTYILKTGMLNDEIPLFYKYYDYNRKIYLPDEEFDSQGICLVYNLITLISLCEMNEDTTNFTKWLVNQMKSGKLYAWYNPLTGEAANEEESTAVYALAAIYAYKKGEMDLYRSLIDRMNHFAIRDRKSIYFGGYGNILNKEFYSFDNLTALWAISIII